MSAMTDRELLEQAARAAEADYEVIEWSNGIEILSEIGGVSGVWDPLTDDGDALRLAVKLAIFLDGDFQEEIGAIFRYPGDPYAATRRAIVRAAAAIGTKS